MAKQVLVGVAVALAFAAPLVGSELPAAGPAMLAAAARGAAETVDSFHAALRRGDTRAAAALLANDALIFEEGGVERTKAEYAASHLSADAEFSKAVQSTLTRRAGQSNGKLAWIASEGRSTGVFRGSAIHRESTETMILRRTGRAWKIVHIHWSSRAGPES